MDTKELVERLRGGRHWITNDDLVASADTIERLERERDEAKQMYAREGHKALVLLEEAATLRARVERLEDGHREIIAREDKAWMPVRAYRTAEEAEVDDVRNETWTKAADISRAALTEEPSP